MSEWSGSDYLALFEEGDKEYLYLVRSDTLFKVERLAKGGYAVRDALSLRRTKSSRLKANSLSNNYIRSIYKSTSGDLWVCTQFGGLNRVRLNHKDFKQHHVIRFNQSGKLQNCWAIAERRDGKLIAGFNGPETGLYLIDPTHDTSDAQFKKLHPNARTYVINPLGDDRFLIGGDGLWLLKQDRLTRFEKDESLNTELINNVFLARDRGSCWVAADDGLFHFDLNGRLIQQLTTFTLDGAEKPARFLSSILKRANGEIWIASKSDGIFKLESGKLNAVSSFEKSARHKLRLPSHRCYGILEDDEQRLWVSCDGGLVSFTPDAPAANNALRHYQQSDGLQGLEFNRRAFFKDGDGLMYFGVTNGLTYFNPRHIGLDTIAFQVAVRSLKLFNDEIEEAPDALMALNHTQNFLSFALSELSFNPRSSVTFRYRLNGSAWQVSNGNVVLFVSLEPGEYEFAVKGVNRDGVESVNTEVRRFRIHPPIF